MSINARIRHVLVVGLLVVAMVAGYVVWLLANHNFHTVVDGRLYRSGQMSSGALAVTIKKYGIRSVVNLRGKNPEVEWYRAETNTTQQLGVAHLDFTLSARYEVSEVEIERILGVIGGVPKPVLIHCNGGADRTALITAAYLFRMEGVPASRAAHQLTMFYGHIPHLFWGYSVAMDRSYWHYVSNRIAQSMEEKRLGLQAVPSP